MARGGFREGAGRKAGQKSSKTIQREAIAEKALADGMTPLEVMLDAMREAYTAGHKRDAALIAKDAAPYIHPRLSSINTEVTGPGGGPLQAVSMSAEDYLKAVSVLQDEV